MRKVKSDALWRGLSAQQQETLDHWLFEEKLGYTVILPRAQIELGFKGQMSSLKRYCARREKERTLTRFENLRNEVAAVSGAPVDEKALRTASMKLLGEFLFQQVRQSPDKVKDWGMVASLIVDNDRNELLRELKGEELKVRQQAMAFAREKFQFDMAKRALAALPELLELAEAKRDPATRQYEENIRLNRVRRSMFGPGIDIHPESAQEAAEMRAAKRERETRREAEARRLRDSEEMMDTQPPPPSSQYYEEYMATKAERKAQAQERERVFQESKAQASVVPEAERVEREKLREQREAQARLEEMREVCGWQEVPQPPTGEES